MIEHAPLELVPPRLPVDAAHFVRRVRARVPVDATAPRLATTLDASLQRRVQAILDGAIDRLSDAGAGDGAVLVTDHRTDEILAWVDGGGLAQPDVGHVDAILALRQPGSTLKPFLYGLALESGWTAATILDDAPLEAGVGHGLHSVRNYSRIHYGPLRLREALANSLNVPAVHAIRHVGRGRTLDRFRELGFTTLSRHPDVYGDGLALGNGEVSLLELVGAYAALARGGVHRPLRWSLDPAHDPVEPPRRVLDPEAASILADILSDPDARALEFGRTSILDGPVPTAVKTGTSTDYCDAWAVGFTDRHVVGIWMGNLDRTPMRGISGSRGPALVLRGVLAELHRARPAGPLPLSRRLERHTICRETGTRPGASCPTVEEWFRPGRAPDRPCSVHSGTGTPPAGGPLEVRLRSPTPGLHLALDPRIPDDLERFPFRVEATTAIDRVDWIVDGRVVASTRSSDYLWAPTRGEHRTLARVHTTDGITLETAPIGFRVK